MEQFLEEVEAYADACGLKPGTVVQRACGASGRDWSKWKSGRGSCSLVTADRIRAYIAENPPSKTQEDAA